MSITETSCYAMIHDKMKGRLPDEVIEGVAKEFDKLRENHIKSLDADMDKFTQAKMKYVEARKLQLESAKAEYYRNQVKRKETVDFLEGFENKEEGLKALLGGRSKERVGKGFMGVEQIRLTREHRWRLMAVTALKRNGTLEEVMSGKIDRDLFRAMTEMKPGGKIPDDIPKHVVEAARVMKSVYDDIHATQKRSGASIGHIEGYAGRNTHDVERIIGSDRSKEGLEKSYKEWSGEILKHLDHEKTFGIHAGDTAKIDEMLKGIFEDIQHGKNRTAGAMGSSDDLITVGISKKLGNKIDQSRKLHFKDGDAIFEYNSKYGYKNAYENLLGAIDFHSRSSALVNVLGTNPEATIARLARENDLVERNGDMKRSIRNLYDDLAGYTDASGLSVISQVGRGVRAMINATKLWKSGINSISDLGTAIAMIEKTTGSGHFSKTLNVTAEFFKNVPREQREEIARKAMMMIDTELGLLHNKINTLDDNIKGGSRILEGLLRAEAFTFKYSGLNDLTAIAKVSTAHVLMKDYAELTTKGFAALPDHLQKNIKMYGMSAGEFNLIAKTKEMFHGNEIVSPEGILKLTTEDIADHLDVAVDSLDAAAVDTLRRNLSEKFSVFISDVAEHASPTPSARERAIMLQGMPKDTAAGQAARLVAQFKSFPLTMSSVARRIADTGDGHSMRVPHNVVSPTGAKAVSSMMIYTSTLGLASLALSRVADGKNPPELDSETFTDALIRGGGAGIYADYLLADYEKNYKSFIVDLAGPSGGMANDMAKLFAQSLGMVGVDEDAGKFRSNFVPNVATFAKKHTVPNIPLLGSAIKYFMVDGVREMAAPGSRERALKNMRSRGEYYVIPKIMDSLED